MDGDDLIARIRVAITRAGGCATCSQISRQLKATGSKVNWFTILSTLRKPTFILTDRGWQNELRQVEMF